METRQFKDPSTGRLVEVVDARGARGLSFVPASLPPKRLDLGRADLRAALSSADQHLARLDGLASRLRRSEELFESYLRREAQLSSAIEGTRTTLTSLALAEASARHRSGDEQIVLRYVEAFIYGLERVDEIGISTTLLLELHEKLMDDREKQPGILRDCVVALGSDLLSARFVPPPHFEVPALLDDLRNYLENDREPALVKLAVAHYQFEAIHPFRDGNGRLGRMMISLWLRQQRILTSPMLYISAYFEQNKMKYYDALLKVSTDGAWEDWIVFFLEGVARQSRDAFRRANLLLELRDQYYSRITAPRSSQALYRLIDDLFVIPAISAPDAAMVLGVTYNAARESIRKLENAGILVYSGPPKKGDAIYWVAEELVELLDRPLPDA